jgi:ketohexokinase
LISLPFYPEEDQKLRATALTTRVGGNVPNTLNVLSQVKTDEDRLVFLSVYARHSLRLTDALSQKAVEVRGLWRQDCAENPRSFILQSGKSGSRTIVNYNG